ncbi:MAG: RNA pseudouridine synthase [Clostridia bacterium]|nr:RNA pseudouridine synthase [Clostridia bacterium]
MEVLYLCQDYIIIRKPYGMLSEKPADGAQRANVPDAAAAVLEERGMKTEGVFCVHRLDATTEGVMVYALTKKAAALLSGEIAAGRFRKTYLAWITADESLPREGQMRDFLFFDRRADKSFVVKPEKKGAKEARLSYTLGDAFLLDGELITPASVQLETGRTHQIRVQFASRKSPLAGDGKYGSRVKRKGASLWSVRLSFFWNGEEKVYTADVHP